MVDLVRKEINEKPQPDSMVRLDTGNGHGSTNTRIRVFTNTTSSVGSDITVQGLGDTTNGTSILINRDGVYSITYNDDSSSIPRIGLSLNSVNLTTDINQLSQTERLVQNEGGSNRSAVSVTLRLSAGDVIRPHTNGSVDFRNNDENQLTVTQLYKL